MEFPRNVTFTFAVGGEATSQYFNFTSPSQNETEVDFEESLEQDFFKRATAQMKEGSEWLYNGANGILKGGKWVWDTTGWCFGPGGQLVLGVCSVYAIYSVFFRKGAVANASARTEIHWPDNKRHLLNTPALAPNIFKVPSMSADFRFALNNDSFKDSLFTSHVALTQQNSREFYMYISDLDVYVPALQFWKLFERYKSPPMDQFDQG